MATRGRIDTRDSRTMAVQFGHVGEFEEGCEEWTQYAERLGHFLTANGITDGEKKQAVFLSVIGPKAYKLLGSLIAPAKPGEKTYKELVEVMTQHHNPPPSEIIQRYKFDSRERQLQTMYRSCARWRRRVSSERHSKR